MKTRFCKVVTYDISSYFVEYSLSSDKTIIARVVCQCVVYHEVIGATVIGWVGYFVWCVIDIIIHGYSYSKAPYIGGALCCVLCV